MALPIRVFILGWLASSAQSPAQEKPAGGGVRLPQVSFPLEATTIDAWMERHGWETQRGNPRSFRVGDGRMVMVSDRDSVALGTRRGFPVRAEDAPRLRFRFRIGTLPGNTDLGKKSSDDAAFRLMVAFDRDKGLLRPPHTIAYVWAESGTPGQVVKSGHFDNLRYLVIGSGLPDDPGEWITVERDLLADYRRVFPEAKGGVPALAGLLLKCDSNHTGTSASSEVGSVELLAPAQ